MVQFSNCSYTSTLRKCERGKLAACYTFLHLDKASLDAYLHPIWGSEKYSCSIITLKPNSIIGEVHDRMPFIVPRDRVMMWLDTKIDDVDLLLAMIRPYPSTEMARKQVSGLEAGNNV